MPLRVLSRRQHLVADLVDLAKDFTAGPAPSSTRTSSTGDGVAAVNGRVSSK